MEAVMDRLLPWFRRPAIAAVLIGVAAQLLFSIGVTRPSKPVFDEVHYLPAARTMLALERPANREHPLLGKELIAGGIAIFGDTPLGWRALSSLAGTATVLGVFAILVLLYGSVGTAAFGALLTAVNIPVFIQARIAMLDGFMAAFVVLGIAAALWAMRARPAQVRRRWLLAALLLGLGTACKWTAAPYVAFVGAGFWVAKWRRPELWAGLSSIAGVFALGVLSIAAYALTFAPAFFYGEQPLTLATLPAFQREMLDLQRQVLAPHTYQSSWWSWPLLLRPIWYLYEPVDGAVRGILLIGNPAIYWGGLIAIAALAFTAWRRRDARAGALVLLWLASIGMWAMIPKSLGFFYYYHLSGIWLCLALPAAFREVRSKLPVAEAFVGLAVGLFVYFYPIISALALPNDQAFNHWMWFDSWR
jgi:dolichyl-phosphate-mannose-protein mannosyltransferase